MTRPPRPSLALAGLLVAALAGCTARHTVERTETGAPRYDELRLVYELHDGRGVLASPAIQPVEYVSHEDAGTAEPLERPWSRAELAVEYPHAEARAGYARATLRLSRAGSATDPTIYDAVVAAANPLATPAETAERDEIWVLDLPREQVDLLLVDLARTGFFEDQSRPAAAARIGVRLDDGEADKPWDAEPRLDDLAERVYTEGWIRGFSAPAPSTRPWWSFR